MKIVIHFGLTGAAGQRGLSKENFHKICKIDQTILNTHSKSIKYIFIIDFYFSIFSDFQYLL